MECLQTEWTALFKRFYTFKAARCEPVTLKSVNWYLLPLINHRIEKGIGPREFSDYHMEKRDSCRSMTM